MTSASQEQSDAPSAPGLEELPELMPDSSEQARIGTLVGDRYRITELLGTGGMGAVYKAEHIHMRKLVALKVLHREMTVLPDVVARFEREAIAAGRIDHPNVVQARDFGRLADGAYYLVLDYVDGEPLGYVLEKEAFTIARSLNIATQVAEALAAAHDENIVHRDLKPDNVMLVRQASGFERIRVLDFGIAKIDVHERGRSQRPLTRMGTVFGTPEYMSPEQASGQAVDHRADLYALGLLLYRMISGVEPFQADELNAVLMMQITQPVPPLSKEVPEPVQKLVLKLLEKQPDARYQSAPAVVAQITTLLASLEQDQLNLSVAPDPHASAEPKAEEAPNGALKPAPLSGKLDQSFLGARVPLGESAVPLWRLGVVALILIGLGTSLIALLSESTPKPTPPVALASPTSSADPKVAPRGVEPADPELEALLGRAFAGDEAALQALGQRPEPKRSLREWLALGRGSSKLERHLDAMKAYRGALELDRASGNDPLLRRDIWQAMRDGQAVELAIQLAAAHLGAVGADMLYQIWVETKDVTPVTQQARKLLQQADVRNGASAALRFLLEWREAMSCEDYRELVPRAALSADTRALTLLQRAQSNNDCAIPEEALEAAITALKARPAPLLY